MNLIHKFYVLVAIVLLIIPLSVAQEKVFEVSLDVFGKDETNTTINGLTVPEYKTIEAVLTGLRLTETTFITNNTQLLRDDIRAELISKGNAVYSTFVPISFLLPESAIIVPVTQAVLFLPYSDADFVKIYKSDKEILSIELKENLCNSDNQCGQYENYLSCQLDCPSGSEDNFCDKKEDNICDVDCLFGDPDCYSYPKYSKFSQSLTTDFSKVNREYLGYLSNVRLGIEGKGQIDFGESRIDVSGADFDRYVMIEDGRVSIDIVSLPGLNKPAKVLFFGEYKSVLKDGVECHDCQVEISEAKTIASVSGFDGVYTVSSQVSGQDYRTILFAIISAIIIGFIASRFLRHHV